MPILEKNLTKLKEWLRTEDRYQWLIKAFLMGCLPLLCCLVTCAMQGKTIGDVYLPMSEWNDELFYFKQVEGIVSYGFPQGFFGFNESHALALSFAAWSPVLVFPWIIFGRIFGWGLMSPIVCNILLLSVTMLLFVLLTRPNWKQIGVLTLLFCLYTPFVRYMLSGMPEIICFSLLILFYAIAINYLANEKIWKLVLLFVLSGLMTLMRPYLLLFMLLPTFLWIRKKKWIGIVGSGVVMLFVLGLYAMIKHYFGAEYFAPLFFTDWVDAFFEKGIFGGIYYTLSKLRRMGGDFVWHTKRGFSDGLASGAFFGGYLIMLLVLGWYSVVELWQCLFGETDTKEKKQWFSKLSSQFIISGHLAFSFVGMLIALLLMYKLTEGSKHLLTFMAAGIFVISLMKTKTYKKAVIIGAAFVYLYSYKAVDPYDYQVPFVQEDRRVQIDAVTESLKDKMILETGDVPNFQNSIIWVLNDELSDGYHSSRWQAFYGIPKGFGISCCYPDFVTEHFDTLQSRYIALPTLGKLDERCKEAGYEELYSDEEITFYKRY